MTKVAAAMEPLSERGTFAHAMGIPIVQAVPTRVDRSRAHAGRSKLGGDGSRTALGVFDIRSDKED
jgi:hypothetical protein